MARRNPVSKLADTALSTLKDPKAAAGKVVDQAKGTVALGRLVAETAGSVVGKAAARRSRKETYAPRAEAPVKATRSPLTEPASPPDLRPVPDVNEPAHTQKTPPRAVPRSGDSPKKQGDALKPAGKPAKKPAPKKTAAKKTAAKKTAAKPTPRKAPSPADVAGVVEAKVAEDPSKTAATAATTPAKKAAAKKAATRSATAAKTAPTEPTEKSGPGAKLPARKSPQSGAKKSAAKQSPKEPGKTEGTQGAGE
ncbi:MAG: hypothetical protein ACRDPR_06170 [Nocardioidaceae bacterium]